MFVMFYWWWVLTELGCMRNSPFSTEPLLNRAGSVLFSHPVLIHLLLAYCSLQLDGLQNDFSIDHLLLLFRAFLGLD